MKVRKRGMFNQLFIWLAILLLAGNTSLGFLAYNRSETALFTQIQSNAKSISQCAAMDVSGEILEQLMVGDEQTENYEVIVNELALFRDNADIEYIYTLRQVEEERIEFVVDSDTEEPAAIGEECEITDAMYQAFSEQITTADELGEIAGNMNAFIGQIRSPVKDVSDSTKDILLTGEELSATVNDNTHVMSCMNSEIEEISANMERSAKSSMLSSESLSASAEHIEAFAQKVNEICEMVQQANKNAQITSATAKENRKNALDAIGVLQKRMERTGKDAQKIEQVKQILNEMIRFVSEDVAKDYDSFAASGEEYGNTTDTIHIQMVEIGNQSKEISKNIADINASVENITSTVTLTAESANGLALSTHKIAESFEDLSTASQKNSLQSENLREQINKYTF